MHVGELDIDEPLVRRREGRRGAGWLTTPENGPSLFHEAEHWLELVMSDSG